MEDDCLEKSGRVELLGVRDCETLSMFVFSFGYTEEETLVVLTCLLDAWRSVVFFGTSL